MIGLGGGLHSYGQVAEEPLVVFFDGAFTEDLQPKQAIELPVLFRIWVHNDAVRKGIWDVIGNLRTLPSRISTNRTQSPGHCRSTIAASQIQVGSVLPQRRTAMDSNVRQSGMLSTSKIACGTTMPDDQTVGMRAFASTLEHFRRASLPSNECAQWVEPRHSPPALLSTRPGDQVHEVAGGVAVGRVEEGYVKVGRAAQNIEHRP
jgi:hypothetical protein